MVFYVIRVSDIENPIDKVKLVDFWVMHKNAHNYLSISKFKKKINNCKSTHTLNNLIKLNKSLSEMFYRTNDTNDYYMYM